MSFGVRAKLVLALKFIYVRRLETEAISNAYRISFNILIFNPCFVGWPFYNVTCEFCTNVAILAKIVICSNHHR